MAKTAVVLAGGGSRGAYQIGVWKALREMGIEYQLVTGTSVGALNGALMVQGDYEKALSVWENLSFQDVVGDMIEDKTDLSDRRLTRLFAREALEKGGADISALERFVYSLIDEERFRSSPVDFALVTVEYPSLKPLELKKRDIPREMLGEYLLASAACFPAFQAKEIAGQKYIDGGYHDNMPVNLALEMGAQEIIAVDLESIGISRRIKTGAQKITTIRSLWPLGSFLKFEGELATRNIQLGYLDALKAFGEMDGQLYSFQKDTAFFYTSALHGKIEEILQKARQREPQITNTLQHILMRRMLREFRKRSRDTANRSFTLSRQMIAAAEYLGEIFGMEPQRVYEFGEFLREVRDRADKLSLQPISQPLSELMKLGKELQKNERPLLTLVFCERIEHFLNGGGSLTEFVFISAFWREFVAAVFLYLIRQIPQEEQQKEVAEEQKS